MMPSSLSSSSSSTSVFEACGEGCGYLAAVVTIVAWGSFGVPLKFAKMNPSSRTHNNDANSNNKDDEVNPLVMQSYKTLICFATCWFVFLLGETAQFSPWGIVSGLFWVPAAICGVYGIRNAGLAIAVGTWSSIQVMTSFIFGILIFHETVRNVQRAAVAFLTLITGLMGMARYAGMSSSQKLSRRFPSPSSHSLSLTERLLDNGDAGGIVYRPDPLWTDNGSFSSSVSDNCNIGITPMEIATTTSPPSSVSSTSFREGENDAMAVQYTPFVQQNHGEDNNDNNNDGTHVVVLLSGWIALTKRHLGILGAFINGAWGGCALIPLHYAKRDHGLSGASYLISFAVGSALVNLTIWMVLLAYKYYVVYNQEFYDAWQALPKWHVRQLGWPGFLAGLLFSVGNFGSILAVTYLGQATGYSICQLSLMVSGLWGVYWFREIHEKGIIQKWFISAGVALLGILWLSWEHESRGNGGGHRNF